MDEEALQLSEVYTEMEIEEHRGRHNKKTVVGLENYKDLFKHVKPEGNRILLKGDPGTGKTTFVQRLAFDWATEKLAMFDVVLVVRLKFADKSQSIARMVKDQIKTLWEDDKVSEKDIAEYMKSVRDRVLLVLDGIDEINLKKYSEANEVLVGDRYRKCCILATTRPHAATTLNNKMTTVAKIKGLSMEQAIRFVENFLDEDEIGDFARQLNRKKMIEMYRVPLIVQALALLFRENHKLPNTVTITYDQLVFFLRKSGEGRKDLTTEQVQAAMDEINQLAFKGLIREDKQLVFSRDEIKDDNVRKLGILTAEKAGSGFRPTEVLQFAHKTVQEHSASDHVVKRLLSDDREPWETLVEQFHKDVSTKNQIVLYNTSRQNLNKKHLPYGKKKVMTLEGRKTSLQVDTLNKTELESNFPLQQPNVTHEFTELLERVEYNKTLFRFIIGKLADHPALRDVILKEIASMVIQHSFDPETGAVLPVQEIASYLTDLKRESLPDGDAAALDHVMGAQAPSQLRSCTRYPQVEGVDTHTLCVLPVTGRELEPVVTSQVMALECPDYLYPKNESLLDGDNDVNDNIMDTDTFLVSAALLHLVPTMRFPRVKNLEAIKPCALQVSGTDANITEFIPKVTRYIRHLKNIHVLELQSIDFQDQDLSSTYQELRSVLYQSKSVVSIELTDVDPKLAEVLMENLPSSVRRLSVGTARRKRTFRGRYTFPSEVHLVALQLQHCLCRVEDLFRNTVFPRLKKISLSNHSWQGRQPLTWTREDTQSLLDVITIDRMPALEELSIRDCCLKGCGPELIEIIKIKSFRSAEFVQADLSQEDGQIFLSNIEDGNLKHIEFLNLLDNEEIGPLTTYLNIVCKQRDITLEMNQTSGSDAACPLAKLYSDFIKEQAENDTSSAETKTNVASHLASLTASFTQEETQGMTTFISKLTPKQVKNFIIQISSLTPEQVRMRLAIFSHSKAAVEKNPRKCVEQKFSTGVLHSRVTGTIKNLVSKVVSKVNTALQPTPCRTVQLINMANEYPEVQLVVGTCILVPEILNWVRQPKLQESAQDSRGRQEVDFHEDDMDLD